MNRGIRWPQEHICTPGSGSLSTIPAALQEDAVEVLVVVVAVVAVVVADAVRAVTSVK